MYKSIKEMAEAEKARQQELTGEVSALGPLESSSRADNEQGLYSNGEGG